MPQKYRHVRPGRRFVLSVAAGALASACVVSRSPDALLSTAGSAAPSGNVAGHPPGTMISPGAGATAFVPGVVPQPPGPDAGIHPGVMPRPADAGMPVPPIGTTVCPPEICPNAYDGGADD
jgi:hypothetical protein